MSKKPTTVTLLPRGDDMVEIQRDGVILARAWKDGTRWKTGKLHVLRGIHDERRHDCRSHALGRLFTLAMLEEHATA